MASIMSDGIGIANLPNQVSCYVDVAMTELVFDPLSTEA
jgi:hypothetical protein